MIDSSALSVQEVLLLIELRHLCERKRITYNASREQFNCALGSTAVQSGANVGEVAVQSEASGTTRQIK